MSKLFFSAALTCGIAVLSLVGSANAATISVPNGSFESAGGSFATPTDWQIEGVAQYTGNAGNAPLLPSASDGSQVGSVAIAGDGDPATSFVGGFSSAASLGTYAANTVYTLTFDVGAEGGWWGSWQGNDRGLSAGLGIFTGSGTAATPVLLDTSDLQEPAPVGGESYSLVPGAIVEGSHSYSGWKRFTVTLDTAVDASAVGQDIAVILSWSQNTNFLKEMAFDNVTLDASGVPEPASLVLAAFSGISMLMMRRRTV